MEILWVEGENHGIGLDNVKRIVDKYDGTMVIECDNGRFDIDVIVSFRIYYNKGNQRTLKNP